MSMSLSSCAGQSAPPDPHSSAHRRGSSSAPDFRKTFTARLLFTEARNRSKSLEGGEKQDTAGLEPSPARLLRGSAAEPQGLQHTRERSPAGPGARCRAVSRCSFRPHHRKMGLVFPCQAAATGSS